jgi:tryptophan 2,3-dioxygenase
MTPRQFLSFRSRLEAASGFQSSQFRELEAILGSRNRKVLEHYPPDSRSRAQIAEAMGRASLFDSLLRYLSIQKYDVPHDALQRDVATEVEASEEVQQVLLEVYRDDREPAQVCERFVDLDEGFQEWRYRHVKMVERTIGDKTGTGGSSGAEYLRRTLFRAAFPDLWAIRSQL